MEVHTGFLWVKFTFTVKKEIVETGLSLNVGIAIMRNGQDVDLQEWKSVTFMFKLKTNPRSGHSTER